MRRVPTSPRRVHREVKRSEKGKKKKVNMGETKFFFVCSHVRTHTHSRAPIKSYTTHAQTNSSEKNCTSYIGHTSKKTLTKHLNNK